MITKIVEIDIHYASEVVPQDEEFKQIFILAGDQDGWFTGRYVKGKWLDEIGNEWATVLFWCELPHPAVFTDSDAQEN